MLDILLFSILLYFGIIVILQSIGAFENYNLAIFGVFIGLLLLVSVILAPLIRRSILELIQGKNRKFQRTIKLGNTYRDQKKYLWAIEQYDQALSLNPNSVVGYIHRGETYLNQKEYQWAIQDLDQALILRPKNISARVLRARAYYGLKEYEKAIEDYKQVIEALPDDAPVYFARGMTYLRLKNISQARTDLVHSSKLDPKAIEPAWLALWLEIGKQRPDKETEEHLAEQLGQLAARDGQHFLAYVCRGVALGLRGKPKKGLKELETAIQLDSKAWDTYFWKGILYLYSCSSDSQCKEAVKMIEDSLNLGLPPILLMTLYWLENDNPIIFSQNIKDLLQHYSI